MNQIAKINFTGVVFSTCAMLAAGAIFMGCGAPAKSTYPATGQIPGASSTFPIIPANGIGTLPDLSQFPAAQINALVGTYGGTLQFDDANGNPVNQPYTLTLTKGTSSGKTLFVANMTSGNLTSFSQMPMNVLVNSGPLYGDTTYTISSLVRSVPDSISSDRSAIVLLSLIVDSNNGVSGHPGTFRDTNNIGPVYSASPSILILGGGFSRPVVYLNDDFGKR
jgi:hypothetical protein